MLTAADREGTIPRRRALVLLAAAAALSPSAVLGARWARYRYQWRGRALGARGRMVLAHPERGRAEAAVAAALAEIDRLEQVFSLYRPESELARLNAAGRLAHASHDLRLVLGESQRYGEESAGAFDVTVQPLWRLHARHARARTRVRPRELEMARSLVDYRRIVLDGGAVGLSRPGMALTLNGIAQGYITDRVVELLQGRGFDHVLVQLGETRGLTPPGAEAPWRVAIDAPGAAASGRPWELRNGALATSSWAGTPFEGPDLAHHIFDPATGRSASRHAAVTVFAESAMVADALSTALAVAPGERRERLLRAGGAMLALFFDGRGGREEVSIGKQGTGTS